MPAAFVLSNTRGQQRDRADLTQSDADMVGACKGRYVTAASTGLGCDLVAESAPTT